MIKYYKDRFTMFYINEEFEGYTSGGTWNGFACPFFPFEEAKRIMETFNTKEKPAWYDEEKDAFIFTMNENPTETDEDYEKAKGTYIEIDGEKVKVYGIGVCSWVWKEVEKKE